MRILHFSDFHLRPNGLGKRSMDIFHRMMEKLQEMNLEENIDLGLENNNLIVLCGLCHKEAEDGHIDKQLLYELAEKRENED